MSEDTPFAGGELPRKPGFASWRSYWDFAREVTHHRRYHLSASSRRFLSELLRTSEQRQSRLRAGHRLCRAQVAHSEYDDPDAGPLPRPAMPERMVPLAYAAPMVVPIREGSLVSTWPMIAILRSPRSDLGLDRWCQLRS